MIEGRAIELGKHKDACLCDCPRVQLKAVVRCDPVQVGLRATKVLNKLEYGLLLSWSERNNSGNSPFRISPALPGHPLPHSPGRSAAPHLYPTHLSCSRFPPLSRTFARVKAERKESHNVFAVDFLSNSNLELSTLKSEKSNSRIIVLLLSRIRR